MGYGEGERIGPQSLPEEVEVPQQKIKVTSGKKVEVKVTVSTQEKGPGHTEI